MPNDVRWIRITTDMFDDEKIKIIESLPDADALLIIWVKMICQAGKVNADGWIFLADDVPYSPEELASIFNRPINTVKLAIATFERLRMIELSDDKGLLLVNFTEHQNIEGLQRIREGNKTRQQKLRDKRKVLQLGTENTVTRDVTLRVTQSNATDKIREEYIREENDLLNNSFIVAIQKEVSGSNYRNYYGRLKIAGVEDDKVIIAAPNETVARHIEETGMALLNRVLFSINCDLKPEIVLLET